MVARILGAKVCIVENPGDDLFALFLDKDDG